MADDDKNKNKSDDDKGGEKNKPLSAEEIQAIAKKAEEALAAEDDDDKGGDDDDKGKKGGDDDEPELDAKNLDADKTLKYIDKLKDENAKRRIANKKAEKRLTKLEAQLKEATEALNAATQQIKESDDKTAAEKAKEKSDLENAAKTIEELTGKIKDLEESNAKNQAELAKTNKRVLAQDRENMITRLVQEKEVAFASDFEREGFVRQLTEMDDEGDFVKDNDEVIYEVMKFIKNKKANEDKSTPGPGPGNRKTSTPIGDEIQALLRERNLNADQRKRLDELLELSGQA